MCMNSKQEVNIVYMLTAFSKLSRNSILAWLEILPNTDLVNNFKAETITVHSELLIIRRALPKTWILCGV